MTLQQLQANNAKVAGLATPSSMGVTANAPVLPKLATTLPANQASTLTANKSTLSSLAGGIKAPAANPNNLGSGLAVAPATTKATYNTPAVQAGGITSAAPQDLMKTLKQGSTDTASVKRLQDYLVSQGAMTQAQVNTGYGTYGPQTAAAVAKMGGQTSAPQTVAQAPAQPLAVSNTGYGTANSNYNPTALPGQAGSLSPELQALADQGKPASTPAPTGTPTTDTSGATTYNANTPNATYTQATPTPQAGLIQQLVNQGQMTPEEVALRQKVGEVAQQAALQQAQLGTHATTLDMSTGRQNILANLAQNTQANLAAQIEAYAAQRGVSADVLKSAAGMSAPVTLSGGQYLATPTGQQLGGGMQGGIANATKWAIAQQNMAQGQNYQGQAQELSNALQAMAPLGQKLTGFMTQTGLNPAETPILNQQINKIDSQLHPDAVATMNAAISDIRSYAIQILGSQSGANPTDVTASVSSFDFGNFTPVQLNTLFKNLENMGTVRLSQAQSASQAGYVANLTGGGAAAQGMTAIDQGSLNTGGKTPSTDTNNVLKALGGIGLSAGGAIAGLAGDIAPMVGAGAAVGAGGAGLGAATDLAKKVLF